MAKKRIKKNMRGEGKNEGTGGGVVNGRALRGARNRSTSLSSNWIGQNEPLQNSEKGEEDDSPEKAKRQRGFQ